jgi:hypothetical protein
MAGSKDIRAGGAWYELSLRDGKLTQGLRAAQAKLKAFGAGLTAAGKGLAAIGGVALAPMLASVKVFTDMGSTLVDLSKKTGITVENLSTLGLTSEDSAAGINKMQKFLVKAGEGSAEANKTLSELGLTIGDLAGLSPDEQFKLFADKISAIQDPAIRTARAMAVFGKGGAELLPMLMKGAAGITAMQEANRSLGLEISTESATAAKSFGKSLSWLGKVAKSVAFEIGSIVAEQIQPFVTGATFAIAGIKKWASSHKELIGTIFKVAAGLTIVGAALIGVGTAINIAAKALGGFGTLFTVFQTGFAAIVGILGFVLSPLGLMVAALAGLGAWFFTATEAGKAALGSLGKFFGHLWDIASAAFGGIKDALSAGDLALAGKIAVTGLRIAFLAGFGALSSAVGGQLGDFLGKIGTQITSGDFAGAWDTVVSGMAVVWKTFSAGVVAVFSAAIDKVKGVWKAISGEIGEWLQKQQEEGGVFAVPNGPDAGKPGEGFRFGGKQHSVGGSGFMGRAI